MSTIQQAQAQNTNNMNENSVIKHYKKQLIHRQHDEPVVANNNININNNKQFEEVTNTKIYNLEGEKKEKKTRRKRKNRNCRGQFRHEGMELIKLGSNPSHSLCKTKEPYTSRLEKPPTEPPPKQSVIQTPVSKPQYVHPLPQMVPERRNSREFLPRAPVIYKSPPHHIPYPLPPTYQAPPLSLPYRPTPTLPPPPYPVPRSPPRPVPRLPQVPYNPYFHENKRKVEEPRVVAAIDLTVETKAKRHKCQCECGKSLTTAAPTQEVIISVKDSPVPSTYMRGKMVNGVLRFDQQNGGKEKPPPVQNGVPNKEKPPSLIIHHQNGVQNKEQPPPPRIIDYQNGAQNNEKPPPPRITDYQNAAQSRDKPPSIAQMNYQNSDQSKEKSPMFQTQNGVATKPRMFRIDDLLAKGVRPKVIENNRVIVNPNDRPHHRIKDYSVNSIINRRQSADIDTISISSSGSESMKSPRSLTFDKQIPQGKLFYYKSNNSFIRYFDDTQKKLFIDNITSDGHHHHDKFLEDNKEIIELPKDTVFSSKDNLTVEEYVSEMTLVEKYIPRDFFHFYKFVTGYQICNNNFPVSFLTFLKVYNTNGLKVLLERYVQSLKQ